MKVLMIGLGGVGQRHLRNLKTLLGDQVNFLAYRVRKLQHILTDRLAIESPNNLEERYQIQTFDVLEEALAQKPDIAVIANPTQLHIDVAQVCAEAGCHLFIEKPLGSRINGAQQLADTLKQQKKVGLVGYQLRFHPGLRKVKQLLDQQAVGRVLDVRLEVGEYLPGWHPYEDYRQMYASRKDQGGGVVLTQSHELDYAIWLFGMPRKLMALGGQYGRLEMDVEDNVSVLMSCGSAQQPVPVSVHMDYLQRPPVRTCTISGESGRILWDYHAQTLTRWQADKEEPDLTHFDDFERNQMFIDQFQHFFSCVEGAQEPLVSVEEGARSVQVAEAILESLASETAVTLP